MALPITGTATSAPIIIPPMTMEAEDQTVHARLLNDERLLRRVVKKFHVFSSHLSSPLADAGAKPDPAAIEDAREAFLVELASFQLHLQKSAMTCDAERLQVDEYERERHRIEDEHGTLRGQIEQLKTSLEHAQMVRRRKIEYDLVAEKINTIPTREELENTIASLESDMVTIQSDYATEERNLLGQKTALDSLVAELAALKFFGKDKDAITASAVPSLRGTPVPDGGEITESGTETPGEDPIIEKEEGEEDAVSEPPPDDDIEMGEVEEDAKNVKSLSKKKAREEMEEGEATDGSSELSDPPDDI